MSKNISKNSKKETSKLEPLIAVETEEGKKATLAEQLRTERQNKAIHLWLENIATTLNDAGLDQRVVLQAYRMDVPWTKESVKEVMWRRVQEAMFNKQSSTKLTTKEVTMVAETIIRFLGRNFGVDVPFPTQDNILWGPIVKKPKQ